ncbi:MAG: hypothetical protein N2A40_08085, partial [Desulfobulbaceae bacterium]
AHYTLLDCGSRDIKFIRYDQGKIKNMGWNAECGASMGFTIELLERYYNLDFTTMQVPDSSFSVTCGVLGMSHIFDAVVDGASEAEAVAKFVKGIALNAYNFAGSPDTLYLSGGLCHNPLFVASFPCKVVSLGRFVLLQGLRPCVTDRHTEKQHSGMQSSYPGQERCRHHQGQNNPIPAKNSQSPPLKKTDHPLD